MLRPEKLEDQIQFLLATLIQRNLKDPELGFVTVTAVRLSSDRSIAKVYYTVLGGETQIAASQKALTRAAGFLRSHIAQRLSMKRTPEIRFFYDASIEEGNRMEELLAKLKDEETQRSENLQSQSLD